MRKNLIIWPLLLLSVLTLSVSSCQKESEEVSSEEMVTPDSEGRFPIVFRTQSDGLTMEQSTKAAAVTSLTSVHWKCFQATGGALVYDDQSCAATAGVFSTGRFWPNTSVAYKMYVANMAITTDTGGSYVSPTSNATDIVCGVATSVSYKSVPTITLDHAYARLGTVTVKAPANYVISGVTLSLSAPTGGKYKIDNSSWVSTSTAAAQTFGAASYSSTTAAANTATSANDLYLVPGTYTLTVNYTLTRGAYTEAFTKSTNITLTRGKVNSYSTGDSGIPTGNAQEITFKCTITPWANEGHTITFS